MNQQEKFEIRRDFESYINNPSLASFLKDKEVEFTATKVDMIETLENAVNEGDISCDEVYDFIYNEIYYGHHRSCYFVEIPEEDISFIKNSNENELIKIIEDKGYNVPPESLVLDTKLPENLMIAELNCKIENEIEIVFIESIKTQDNKGNTRKENNYYFIKIDLTSNIMSIRLRPRANVVHEVDGEIKKLKDSFFYNKVLEVIKNIFTINVFSPRELKTTLYKIAKTLTERAERKWRQEVEKHTSEIVDFSNEMKSKLNGFKEKEFDLEFRLKRLLERALIQSNFEQLKQKEEGKLGYMNAFLFSDKSGGRVKASSIEKENAIELSEIYYDTRDTIDQEEKYDLLWVNWFVQSQKSAMKTRLEANGEYGLIHFYQYIQKGDLEYVLSKVNDFRKSTSFQSLHS